MNTYLDLARQGKNDWWRYLISLVLIAFFWLFVGSIPYLVLTVFVIVDGSLDTSIDTATLTFTGVHPLLPFLALMVSFIAFIIGTFIAVRFVHARRFSTLISPRIRWGRFALGFGVWLVLVTASALVEAFLYPGRYELTFDPVNFLPFAIVAIILIPLQTSSEEFFFRGYILQWIGLRLRNIVLLSLISGLLFMLPHLTNPEIAIDVVLLPLFYFAFGAFLAFVSLQDGGLELALGVHAANNLFASLFANYTGSALQTPAIFTATELDAVYSLISTLAAMAIFYLCVFWAFKPQPAEQPIA